MAFEPIYEDYEDLEIVLDPGTATAMRLDDTVEVEDMAIENVDEMLADPDAPLAKEIVLYLQYSGAGNTFRSGGELLDKAYLAGTTKKPDGKPGSAVIALEVPKGTPAIELPDGGYILSRGLTLELAPTDSGIIPGKIK